MILLFVSCAKVSYLAEQGIGQVSLEYDDIDVPEFLKDPNQDSKHKEKVRLIQKAKKFFYQYFDLAEVPIYDEVKMLGRSAVTHLVIYSPKDEIKAVSTWFPIMGNFPYLGFFDPNSAQEFMAEKKKEGFSVYMRPVYAYSTLNHPLMPFDDNILSSFFHYGDRDLVELIFHELVHTILFVGNNVNFNENLAQFIGEKLSIIYHQDSKEQLEIIQKQKKRQYNLNRKIASLISELKAEYKKTKNVIPAQKVLDQFLKERFHPSLSKLCREQKRKSCSFQKGVWNNARFAAFGTYEGKRSQLEDVYEKYNLSLKDFVLLLMKKADEFDGNSEFIHFLLKDK